MFTFPDYGMGRVIRGSRFHWNVNGQAIKDMGRFLAHADATKPTLITMMDNSALSHQLQERLPDSIIIDRHYFPEDTQLWRSWSVKKAADYIRSTTPKNWKGFRLLSNEASTDDPRIPGFDAELFDEAARWHLDLQEELGTDYRQVTGFAVTKSYDRTKISSGNMDFFVYGLDKWRGYLLHGVTDYVFGHEPAYFMHDFPANLFDKDRLQKGNWPESIDLGGPGNYPELWNLLRWHWIDIRRQELGIETPIPLVIIECVHDKIEANRPYSGTTLEQAFRAKYGGDSEGFWTLKNFLEKTYPYQSWEHSLADQFEHMDKVYPDYCLGMNIFTWSSHDRWAAFNGDSLFTLQARIEALPERVYDPAYTVEPQEPAITMKHPHELGATPIAATVRATSAEGTRLRAQPVDGNVLTVIPPEDTDMQVYGEEDDNSVLSPGDAAIKLKKITEYTWRALSFGEHHGWAAEEYLNITEHEEEEPEPEDPPVEEPEEPETPPGGIVDIPCGSIGFNSDAERERFAVYQDMLASVMFLAGEPQHFIDAQRNIALAVRDEGETTEADAEAEPQLASEGLAA